jgi:predicted acetylornithine/succinylornithine family transaminase
VPSALLGTYKLPDFYLERGEGSELIDEAGTRYLDFTSGIAVNAVGYGHPAIQEAIEGALATGLIHVSNLFRTRPGEELARRLTAVSGLDRAFFCNSGAEAVEGALKFAKKWAKSIGGPEKHRIVALEGGFHGRLHGSLAVTARPDYQRPFEPLMPGVDFVDATDLAALDRALSSERTAALILEPIQGEGGVRTLDPEFLRKAREWTAERGIALIFDEIQCGLGRTGRLFAFSAAGVTPDLLCLAKPLAGGLPMGAVLLRESIAEVVLPGDHGTTFGGGPLVSTVALAVLDIVSAPDFLDQVRRKGELLSQLLEELRVRYPEAIREVRGAGLIRGIELATPAAPVVTRARELGLLTVPAGAQVVRLLPPLTVSEDEIRRAVAILEEAIGATYQGLTP